MTGDQDRVRAGAHTGFAKSQGIALAAEPGILPVVVSAMTGERTATIRCLSLPRSVRFDLDGFEVRVCPRVPIQGLQAAGFPALLANSSHVELAATQLSGLPALQAWFPLFDVPGHGAHAVASTLDFANSSLSGGGVPPLAGWPFRRFWAEISRQQWGLPSRRGVRGLRRPKS